MVTTFNDNPTATIIPWSHNDLSSLFRCIPNHKVLVIGEDMNDPIDKNVNLNFSLHNSSHGKQLTNFMLENRLTYLNSKLQKRKAKLWTYIYANNDKAQIDYVFITKKWENSAQNYEAYSSFEGVSSDHRFVTAEIRLSQRKNDARTTTTLNYDLSLHNDRDIREKYMLILRNKFDAAHEESETHTPNDEYENFVNPHLEAAAECIPTKQTAKPRVPWETLLILKKSVQTSKLLPSAIGRTQPIAML